MNLNKRTQHLIEIFKIGAKKDENKLNTLKKELKNNGFKLCGMGVELMLEEMADKGMNEECVAYWKTIGLTNLPYEPF